MKEDNYNKDSDGWSLVGKVGAGTVALAGLVAGIYFGCKAIYDAGFTNGTYQQLKSDKATAKELEGKLQDEGLLLPETACLRYKRSTNPSLAASDETYVSNGSKCFGVTFSINRGSYSTPVGIDATLGDKAVAIGPNASYFPSKGIPSWFNAYVITKQEPISVFRP